MIEEKAEEVTYEGDLSDLGNEVGYVLGTYVVANMDEVQITDFIHGMQHGISLTNGTHSEGKEMSLWDATLMDGLENEPWVSDDFQIGPEGAFERLEIDKEELHKRYMKWVNEVTEECDWKTSFEPEEIVNAIANILETNPQLIK
jgi:hypothetical protein